jgi:nucleoside-diphosphate-sugar epimerase
MDLFIRDERFAKIAISKANQSKVNYLPYSAFNAGVVYDVIINFIGLGCPKKIRNAADELIDVANYYDTLILNYLAIQSSCKYIFISSGVVYGENFLEPIPESGKAIIDGPLELGLSNYAISKISCERRHRNFENFGIIDLRVFSYFNAGYDPSSTFFMSQICNAIRNNEVLIVSADKMVRDYIHPSDFCALIDGIINFQPINTVVDCYSREPIEKITLLENFKNEFGLKYVIQNSDNTHSIFTNKTNYYSLFTNAKKFGYKPNYSSLDGLILECKKLFSLVGTK